VEFSLQAKEHAAFPRALAKVLQRTCQTGAARILCFDSMGWQGRQKAAKTETTAIA
jgi:hypothetical protein